MAFPASLQTSKSLFNRVISKTSVTSLFNPNIFTSPFFSRTRRNSDIIAPSPMLSINASPVASIINFEIPLSKSSPLLFLKNSTVSASKLPISCSIVAPLISLILISMAIKPSPHTPSIFYKVSPVLFLAVLTPRRRYRRTLQMLPQLRISPPAQAAGSYVPLRCEEKSPLPAPAYCQAFANWAAGAWSWRENRCAGQQYAPPHFQAHARCRASCDSQGTASR